MWQHHHYSVSMNILKSHISQHEMFVCSGICGCFYVKYLPFVVIIITYVYQFLPILNFLTLWQHHGFSPFRSFSSILLLGLSRSLELQPAAEALQLNTAGAELRVTALVLLHGMRQYISQNLAGRKKKHFS